MQLNLPGLARRDAIVVTANSTVPKFPSLFWPPQDFPYTLSRIQDIWRFTLLWTIIIYVIFHLGAASIALVMQIGKTRSNWKYMWVVPIIYTIVPGIQALFAGSVISLVIGALYIAGHVTMSTWIPFVLAWINLLTLVISSFSIQGGL